MHITAVCGPGQVERAIGLGAARAIDYTTTDFTNEDAQYDLVLDTVGKSTFE